MITKSMASMFAGEENYEITLKFGDQKGIAKVYVLDPRKEQFVKVKYMHSTPTPESDYYVDIVVVHECGSFTCVTDKLVANGEITITKEKKKLILPVWQHINKLKAIKAFKELS
jgi:hypothetical protein